MLGRYWKNSTDSVIWSNLVLQFSIYSVDKSNIRSSGFVFIRSSGFGLMYQLLLWYIILQKATAEEWHCCHSKKRKPFRLIWVQNMAIAVQKLFKFGWLKVIGNNILHQHSKTNWWNVRVPKPNFWRKFSCESNLHFLLWMPIGRKSHKWLPEWLLKFSDLNLLCEYKILLSHHLHHGTDVSDYKKFCACGSSICCG